MKNEPAIRKMFVMFAGIYQKRFEASEGAMHVWSGIVGDIPEKELLQAAKECCSTCRYPPTPVDILEIVKAHKIEVVKKSLTPTEQKMLDKDPALVWAGAHKKMLTCQDSYRAFLVSPTMPQWVKDAFEAVGGIKLCLMEDSSRLYPRFEKAWNDGKARYLGQETNLLANEQHQLERR